jgi:hypothetical protein
MKRKENAGETEDADKKKIKIISEDADTVVDYQGCKYNVLRSLMATQCDLFKADDMIKFESKESIAITTWLGKPEDFEYFLRLIDNPYGEVLPTTIGKLLLLHIQASYFGHQRLLKIVQEKIMYFAPYIMAVSDIIPEMNRNWPIFVQWLGLMSAGNSTSAPLRERVIDLLARGFKGANESLSLRVRLTKADIRLLSDDVLVDILSSCGECPTTKSKK